VPNRAKRSNSVWRIARASLCAFALIGLVVEYARSQVPDVEQFHHTSWTVENGLSAVFAAQQAPDGFLWLTTAKGVFRFDGVRFESLDEVTNGAVHNAEIDYAYASPSGNVWLTTVNSGLLRWKNNTVTRYPDRRCTPAQAKTGNIEEDYDGTLWIAGSSGLYRLKNGTCEAIRNNPSFPAGFPWAILLDRAGTLWVKWPVGGLYFLPRGQARFEQTLAGAGTSGQRAFLKQAPDGSIWLSDLGGLRRVAGSSNGPSPRTSPTRDLSPPSQFGDFTFSPDGSLWAGSPTGLSHFVSVEQYKMEEPLRAVDSQAFTVKQGLSSSVVSDLLLDKEGNIWVATFSGLDQLRRNVFTTVALPTAPERQLAIAADDNGGVWFGSREQPLSHFFSDGHIQIFPETKNCIALRRTSDGTIWSSGTGQEHLWRIERGAPLPVAFPVGDVQSAADIAVDKNHDVWISTFTPESYHRVGNSWTKLTQLLGRKPGVIGAMTDDANGNVWFAFSRTLVKWDGSEYHRYQFPDDKPMFPVFAIAVRGSHVWMGGSLGIALFSDAKFQFMRWKDAQNPGKVNGLVETAAGELWANGTSGVLRVPKDELKKWLARPDYAISADRIDFTDGLPSLAVERWPEPSMVQSATGEIWFVTSKGLFWVNPADFDAKMNHVPPPVSINTIVLGGHAYLATNGLRLSPSAGNLEINYTAPSFAFPERVQFRYKLENYDKEWQEAGTRRQAFYTGLPPGGYRLRVLASNGDGLWNETGASVNLTLLPAFYQTIWFRCLCGLVALVIVWQGYRLRVERIAASMRARFSERLDERVRVAHDLHDTLLQTISVSKLATDQALERSDDIAGMKSVLQHLSELLGQAAAEGRAALSSLHISNKASNDLANAIRAAIDESLLDDRMQAELFVDGTVRDIHPIVCDEVYRIAYEGIRNAFTHSEATLLQVYLAYGQDLTLRILDNGRGIDSDILHEGKAGHYGLSCIRDRATRIGAYLDLKTSQPGGTEIVLIVPGKAIFLTKGS
jgi:signal transduction histidine kinase/ligand-binding sensor domain-containing protein